MITKLKLRCILYVITCWYFLLSIVVCYTRKAYSVNFYNLATVYK